LKLENDRLRREREEQDWEIERLRQVRNVEHQPGSQVREETGAQKPHWPVHPVASIDLSPGGAQELSASQARQRSPLPPQPQVPQQALPQQKPELSQKSQTGTHGPHVAFAPRKLRSPPLRFVKGAAQGLERAGAEQGGGMGMAGGNRARTRAIASQIFKSL
jgi:hypothetical protein